MSLDWNLAWALTPLDSLWNMQVHWIQHSCRAFPEELCSLSQLCPMLLEATGSLVLAQSLALLCQFSVGWHRIVQSILFVLQWKLSVSDFCECCLFLLISCYLFECLRACIRSRFCFCSNLAFGAKLCVSSWSLTQAVHFLCAMGVIRGTDKCPTTLCSGEALRPSPCLFRWVFSSVHLSTLLWL